VGLLVQPLEDREHSTLAVFQEHGRILSLKEVSKICESGKDTAVAQFFRTLGMPSGPTEVLGFSRLSVK